MLILIFHNLVR